MIMEGTKNSKDQTQQQLATDLGEKALEIAIKNAPIDGRTIRALRRTCKRTKVAADARVKEFTLSIDPKLKQNSKAVQRSGLLNSISKLYIYFDFEPAGDETPTNPRDLSRALRLLNLAVDVCSKSVEVLKVGIDAPLDTLHECVCVIGNSDWKSLQDLSIVPYTCSSMSGFLSGIFLARPGGFPALKEFSYRNPTAAEIEALYKNPAVLDNLTFLFILWSDEAYAINKAPATVKAMRNLLQKATNLERLYLKSTTFKFFNNENLVSLKGLALMTPELFGQRNRVDFAPALARPWKNLSCLRIENATLKGPDLVRIFEAEDTLPVLTHLKFCESSFDVDALSCVRRPHLKNFGLTKCDNIHPLLFKLAQLIKNDPYTPPRLAFTCLQIGCGTDHLNREALSQFLSCPCMAALESLSISGADIGAKGNRLLYDAANHCPKLKHLDLRGNNLGRPAVVLFAGYGCMGAWPELKTIWGILGRERKYQDLENMVSELTFMPQMDAQTTLRQFWPGLRCF